MLERAAEKQVYDELHKGEIVAFLRDHPREFDLIVSADTLVYFGALEDVMAAVAGALRENGVFVFTLESLEGRAAGRGYEIQTHGRYCHDQGYVERLLAGAGMQAAIVQAELRMEAGAPVTGLAVRAVSRGHRG